MYVFNMFSFYKTNLCIISHENQDLFNLYFPFKMI